MEAQLEVTRIDGGTESVTLSKRQPVSIGRHASNDVIIEEDGVDILHCRVSWNKSGYEVAAATGEGVEVNGSMVRHAMLGPGDVLRIGSADIRFVGEERQSKPSDEESAARRERRRARKRRRQRAAAAADDDASDMSALDAILDEEDAEEELEEETPSAPSASPSSRRDRSESRSSRRSGTAAGGLSRLRTRPRRPGEEDVVRSPLVLALTAGGVLLVFLTAVFFFVAGRHTTQARYDAAAQLVSDGKYAQAIVAFEDFIVLHEGHPLAEQAQRELGLARVDQHVSGAVPDWKAALDALRAFLNDRRDEPDFDTDRDTIWRKAGDIALGSAESAGRTFDRKLLDISRDAGTILRTYWPQDNPPEELGEQIVSTRRKSEQAIVRHEAYNETLAQMKASMEADDPLGAVVFRRDLLTRYPEFTSDRKLDGLLKDTLEQEQSQIASEEINGQAAPADSPDFDQHLTLNFHARNRSDEVSVGKCVPVVAKDTCVGVDTVTGEPVWRRLIGPATPFFPVREPTLPSLLCFDTRSNELIRLEQDTGDVVWSAPLDEVAAGSPLILAGQVYVATRGGSVYAIDLDNGSVLSRLTFAQPVSGPVPIGDGDFVVVAGDREVVYTLRLRPLECVAVSLVGHAPGSVEAPLLAMGPFALLPEKLATEQTRLHLLRADPETGSLAIAARDRLPGWVVDPPVIRGRDLFVPSTGERVTAFTVTDATGQPPLVQVAAFQGQGGESGPVFLSTGPDRQLWMAGTSLRRIQLTSDALQPDPKLVNFGVTSQPLQYSGSMLFHARHRFGSSAVTVTRTDRQSLESDWQAALGQSILAARPAGNDGDTLVCVTELGHVFRVDAGSIRNGGFSSAPRGLLGLADREDEHVAAATLDDGRTAVWTAGASPTLWLLSAAGTVSGETELPEPLQHPPVAAGNRIILPFAGRLSVLSGQRIGTEVKDFTLPAGQAVPAWSRVTRLESGDIIAVTADGLLRRIRERDTPERHLAEAGRLEVGGNVLAADAHAGGQMVIADDRRQLHLIDLNRLEISATRTFPVPVISAFVLDEANVIAETASRKLHCLATQGDLESKWSIDLPGSGLAGRPVQRDGRTILALRDGQILYVDDSKGTVSDVATTGAAMAGDLIRMGDRVIATTLDGSLIDVTDPAAAVTPEPADQRKVATP
ncbi:Outer membrane protein assembly factor BamB [Maioricimonas rarisocia]|uniref:Outer membrane protein assembly factor BamB n=1 Tax=Maioricimonas rarisocia TaxID=2528026 RepID=A0A517Z8P9_9PLAN|nr:PQQ-binding-like beta-propeller repeat protein [Maioricimonas rarisocia]QDU38862.1 Outer membrane protein assembly factor BamB [Maioricimonas rarisocia]